MEALWYLVRLRFFLSFAVMDVFMLQVFHCLSVPSYNRLIPTKSKVSFLPKVWFSVDQILEIQFFFLFHREIIPTM